MVGSSKCAASLASTNRRSPLGSSRVLSRALAVMWFMRSAGNTSTALPRPRALVRWENSTASRIASTRISLLGLRFLSSMSLWAFSLSGQPKASIWVSGMSTNRSAWVRTSMAWQLPHWPQAPWALGVSHNQARTNCIARLYCPSPDGPASSQAWPRWASNCWAWAAIQGAWAGALLSSLTLLKSLTTAIPALEPPVARLAKPPRVLGRHGCGQNAPCRLANAANSLVRRA